MLLKSAYVFDASVGEFRSNTDVLIIDDKIVEVSQSIDPKKYPNIEVLNLKGQTIIPGLIDMHTHVLENINNKLPEISALAINILQEHDIYRASRAIKYLNSYLSEGFTSIRDLGNSSRFGDVALKNAIREGYIKGPRLYVSGPIMASVGGQIAGILDHHQDIIEEEYRIIKSKEDAILAVKEHVNQGVDLIKICADSSPNKTYLTIDEIKTIANIAHEYGLKVTAHANTPKSIENALIGGVDGIEHGYLINDKLLKKLNDLSVPFTLTDFYLSDSGKEYLVKQQTPNDVITYIQDVVKSRLKEALKNNNTLVFGSDVYVETDVSRGKIAKNILITYHKNYKIPITKVLQMATYNAAKAMGKESLFGDIKPGLKADIVIIDGDLRNNINQLKNIKQIIKNGKFIK